MKKLTLPALAGLMLISSVHAAEPKTALNDAALKNGQKSALFCRHCHGPSGNSMRDDVPNLAGQNEAYLLVQMNKFVTGQRKNEFMEGLIKALTPEERASISLYFSQQSPTPKPVKNGAQVADGKKLYDKVCINCHGASGYGTEKIPRLASQQPGYLEESLKRYRSGSGERIDLQMAAYTRNLKDADILNLAAYISSMP
jgi:cytochrome c553